MSAIPTPVPASPAAPAAQGRGADPRALRVAQWVQERVPTGDVYLFGSRARGDWDAESDIDLMVLAPAPLPHAAAAALAYDAALRTLVARLFGTWVRVQVLSMARAEFDWARTSPNHLAGGVQRDGLDPGGQPMTPVKQNNPWPAAQQHLQSAHRSLYDALRNAGISGDRLAVAEAHNALENVRKAYASACGVKFERHHWLNDLPARIPAVYQEVDLPSADWLQALSHFRANHAYLPALSLPGTVPEVLAEVQRLCRPLAARVLAMCRKSPRQVRYERHPDAPWDLQQPLAGMETAHPDDFRRIDAREAARIRQEAERTQRERTQREALARAAELFHTAADLAAFDRYLDRTPAADWPDIKDVIEGELPRLPETGEDSGADAAPDTKGNGGPW